MAQISCSNHILQCLSLWELASTRSFSFSDSDQENESPSRTSCSQNALSSTLPHLDTPYFKSYFNFHSGTPFQEIQSKNNLLWNSSLFCVLISRCVPIYIT